MTNNTLQNITHKTKDRVTRTALRPGDELDMSFEACFCFCGGRDVRALS